VSEKYSVMMDGREPWFHRDNYPMTHDEVCETLNTQSTEIEELRKLIHDMAEYAGKSDMQEIIQEAESKISELDANELKGLQLMRRVQVVISNTSEIPNSSEFIVTEADQREADRAIADGSAKLQMPETGHGITEVSDAAEGG